MNMNGLTVGRMVHFVMQFPELHEESNEYAAVISRVHINGSVRLHVFAADTTIVKESVSYNADKKPETWHWIEEA